VKLNLQEVSRLNAREPKEDLLLLKKGSEGDEFAWQSIVHKYSNLVFNICLQFTGNVQIAEELTQDIFIKVYKNSHELAHHPNFKWWLIKTSKNRCIDYYRKHKAEKLKVDTEKVADKLAVKENAEKNVLFSEKVKLLHKAIMRLPLSLRTLIILRDIQEMAYEEIAKMLKIPLGTVKSKLNRARAELYKILETFQYFNS
jgi:RNA polymerase sigma-70 factor, ECF subfamily